MYTNHTTTNPTYIKINVIVYDAVTISDFTSEHVYVSKFTICLFTQTSSNRCLDKSIIVLKFIVIALTLSSYGDYGREK